MTSTPSDSEHPSPPFEQVSLKAFYNDSTNLALVRVEVSDDVGNETDNKTPTPHHVPSTVILVLDISGSMGSGAARHDDSDGTASGLTQLDIVKHASHTIIESLNEQDHLAIVTFSSTASTAFELTPMTKANRDSAIRAVKALQPDGCTNLYDGLIRALEMIRSFSQDGETTTAASNPNILLLTDGLPNVSPPRGELESLERYLESFPQQLGTVRIATFGFGWQLQSSLLAGISKTGCGGSIFGFIPDSSFVGTVFINTMANLLCSVPQTTNRKTVLNLESLGPGVCLESCLSGQSFTKTSWGLSIQIPPLVFGQTLDILVQLGKQNDCNDTNPTALCAPDSTTRDPFRVTLESKSLLSDNQHDDLMLVGDVSRIDTFDEVEDCWMRRAMVRSELIGFIQMAQDVMKCKSNPSPTTDMLQDTKVRVSSLLSTNDDISSHADVATVVDDMEKMTQDLNGQITEAYSRANWYKKWGRHYVLSLARAHTLQQCTNFKDPGLQTYCTPNFSRIRDALEEVFLQLPPPKPSRPARAPVRSMRAFHCSSNPCFASGLVAMANGTHKDISQIRAGDLVKTTAATTNGKAMKVAKVRCVIETLCESGLESLVELEGGVRVTPWHPIRRVGTMEWLFPCSLVPPKWLSCARVYSFVLDHGVSMQIGGYNGIALAHGIHHDKILKHDYLGTDRVLEDLSKMVGWSEGFVQLKPNPTIRDPVSNRIVGLRQGLPVLLKTHSTQCEEMVGDVSL